MAAPRAMPLTEFEKEVLGWLYDDYESARSITNDIGRKLGRPSNEAEVPRPWELSLRKASL